MRFSIIIIFIFIFSCHSANVTTFGDKYYPPTYRVEVYSDVSQLKGKEYIEIGYVEAKGGVTIDKQTLLNDMMEKAKAYGADALIKVEFIDRPQYHEYIGSFTKPGAKAVMIRFKNR